MENGNHIETRQQPHASRNNNGAAERTTPQIMMPRQMVEPRHGEGAKKDTPSENHCHTQTVAECQPNNNDLPILQH